MNEFENVMRRWDPSLYNPESRITVISLLDREEEKERGIYFRFKDAIPVYHDERVLSYICRTFSQDFDHNPAAIKSFRNTFWQRTGVQGYVHNGVLQRCSTGELDVFLLNFSRWPEAARTLVVEKLLQPMRNQELPTSGKVILAG